MAQRTTAVIVDDELHCRDALAVLLQRRFPHIQLLGSAANVHEGVELVDQARPTVLFLDVEMGDRTGFDLLEAIGPPRPHVIFTTAHEGYAVKAIRFSALDFLLKPIDADELQVALDRVPPAMHAAQDPDRFSALLRNVLLAAHADKRIALPVAEGLEVVDTDETSIARPMATTPWCTAARASAC